MKERRTQKYMLLLTPTERAALAALAERDGCQGADVVRRLVRREAIRFDLLPRIEVQNVA